MSALLCVQGLNFAATLLDTDDLSTGRGASLAYLSAPEAIITELASQNSQLKFQTVFTGASEGFYLVDGATANELDATVNVFLGGLRSGAKGGVLGVCQHLSFACSVVEVGDDYTKAENAARAIIRKRQLQSPTIDIVDPTRENAGRCRIDGFRPADGGQITTGGGKRPVSRSVHDRRQFGREMRQAFYKRELGNAPEGEGINIPEQFANSFQDIVADPPSGLPESLQAKMAVLYMDGNAFGITRAAFLSAKVGDRQPDAKEGAARATAFSEHVIARRRALLASILARLDAIAESGSKGFQSVYLTDGDGSTPKCRFETLLWGGDEMTFVFPAWLTEHVLDCVAENLCDPAWKLLQTGKMLTHGGGLVVCNAKTPIREVIAMAGVIADHGKSYAKRQSVPFSGFEYLILESEAAPPDISKWRKAFYGVDDGAAFTIGFDRAYGECRDVITKIKGQSVIARGQVYDLLRRARAGGFDGVADIDGLNTFIDDWIKNTPVLTDEAKKVIADLRKSPAFAGDCHPLLPFKRLAELWDYFDVISDCNVAGTQAQEVENV